jgi:TctA family transporter
MELALQGLTTLATTPSLWWLLCAAVAMGMVFGAVPGLGGKLGIVLSIPIVFGMDALHGSVFLVAMHAVVHTGGSIPSILVGVPGTGPDAATICDGHPMAQRGEAGRALGASLAASAVGGVFGAAFLAALLPVLQTLMLSIGPAELFGLAVFGVTFIGAVSGTDLGKGLLVGAFGLMLSFVGSEPQTGVTRFSMGLPVLWDGLDLTTVMLGVYAVPEALAIAVKGRVAALAAPAHYGVGELWTGVADVFRHGWLTLRTSFIGAVIGLVPGLGGDVASWVCYGHAVWSSKSPERFGSGAVEGVIGPEAANNSKEGGALLPTLFFGVPGSSGMAVMLGAFVVLGLQPGPDIARNHMDLVWVLIWTLVVSNLLGATSFFLAGRVLVRAVMLRAGLLVPFVLLLVCAGALVATGRWENLAVLAFVSMAGVAFKWANWPRAPLALGIVLGPMIEVSLHQSLAIWGTGFLLRPITGLFVAATLTTVLVGARRSWSARATA